MFKNPFQVAVTFAIVALIIKIAVFSMGIQHGNMEKYIPYIYMFILLAAVFFGIRSNKIMFEGTTSFGQDFKSGARTASFFALLIALITYVYYAKIDVDFFSIKQEPLKAEYMKVAQEKFAAGVEKREDITKELSNQLYGMNAYLSPYFQAMWTMFGLVFMGLFNSLVFAFMMKKFPGFKS